MNTGEKCEDQKKENRFLMSIVLDIKLQLFFCENANFLLNY